MVRVSAREFAREQLENQPVTVEVMIAGGKKFSVQGKVILRQPNDPFVAAFTQVRAEVRRPSRDAPWPLYPGMKAEMFISREGRWRPVDRKDFEVETWLLGASVPSAQ